MSSSSETHLRKIAFWKKHQTLLQTCANLSSHGDVKIFVSASGCLFRLTLIDCILPQCIINVPDRYAQTFDQTFTSDQAGNVLVKNLNGTTVIFDSFSSEEEVRNRNEKNNSISGLSDPRNHFDVEVDLRISTKTAAVLSPSTVSSYRVVDRTTDAEVPGRRIRSNNNKRPFSSISSAQTCVLSHCSLMSYANQVSETEHAMNLLKKRCLERGYWADDSRRLDQTASSVVPEHFETPMQDLLNVYKVDECIAIAALRDMALPSGARR